MTSNSGPVTVEIGVCGNRPDSYCLPLPMIVADVSHGAK